MGRPKKSDEEAKRAPLGFRTTRELRAKLEEAADASGRSLAQEMEIRLERSFDFVQIVDRAIKTTIAATSAMVEEKRLSAVGGSHNAQLGELIAYIAFLVEAEREKRWTEDQDTRHAVESRLLSMIPRLLRNPVMGEKEPSGPLLSDLAKTAEAVAKGLRAKAE
ncbi:hypothetical protein GCM10007036_10590 [Alsobacter metallidurans]|uniref:Relaxosome protein TraY n=1 Tax=Alsobacter metallidurans TaxID=340221 RepID=A0A917I4Y0_9HYPH|nr:TraY domain-containing protein [Alsobacter metallidurans]GGH12607.1 hypothetical protein GCM10007036_10590 [Alsobacter metallidurans]